MSQLECEITAQRDDGAFRWRRFGATEPNGWIPGALVPPNVSVGSIVVINFDNNAGRTAPVSCRLREVPIEVSKLENSENLSSPNPPPVASSGLLFLVNIMNPLENENAEGKIRPAVLVSRSGDDWRVMGLTTKATYESGESRRPIPNHTAVGLTGPGFIWGGRLTRVTSDSIHGFIGYANHQLVEEIIDLARRDLTPSEIDDLRSVTRPSAKQARLVSAVVQQKNESQLSLTSESLLAFFSNSDDQVTFDLVDYFRSGNYTGRHFEFFSQTSNPFVFDGNDIAALMCLSITPKANIASDLLCLTQRKDFVIQPGEREVAIWTRDSADYAVGSQFHNLFDELCQIPNVAAVVASKLMASKFPHSIPIYDNDVSALLNHPQEWWLGWYEAMQSANLRKRLVNLRESLELHNVSLLRIADVALWMEAQRRKNGGSL